MKLETAYTSELVKHLRERLAHSVVFKHSDAFTPGIPDISINWWLQTFWLELKIAERHKIRKHHAWGKQLLTTRRLAQSCKRCWFVIYEESGLVLAHPAMVQLDCSYTGFATYAGHKPDPISDFIRNEASRHVKENAL